MPAALSIILITTGMRATVSHSKTMTSNLRQWSNKQKRLIGLGDMSQNSYLDIF